MSYLSKELTEVIESFPGSKERIAARLGKSVRTIERWAKSQHTPSLSEQIRLKKIIAGYKQQYIPLLSNSKGAK
jgi:hypothetical protein